MQTLSPKSTTSSLPIPKNPAIFFENPLTRPEIGTATPNPMVSPQQTVPAVDLPREIRLPTLLKKENSIPVVATISDAPAIHAEQSPVIPQNKNIADMAVPARRKLPDEIKEIFKRSSEDFATYAKNGKKDGEKKNGESAAVLEKPTDVMDEWDRALLLGEYPPERPKPKRLSFVPTSAFVPKKNDKQEIGAAFPSRVMDAEISSPIHRPTFRDIAPPAPNSKKPKHETDVFPNKINSEKEVIPPTLPIIPAKPKPAMSSTAQPTNLPSGLKSMPVIPSIPQKPKNETVAIPHKINSEKAVILPPLSVIHAIPQKPKNETVAIPHKITDEKAAISSPLPIIPVKPKPAISSTAQPLNPPPLPDVPVKHSSIISPAVEKEPLLPGNINQIPKTEIPAVPPTNMSETLVGKIIEGQMRVVFENAPPLLQKEFEKMTAKKIMSDVDEQAPRGSIENEVWKKRLREYLTKLREQAMSVFADKRIAEPTEEELVLDYVKRVYPILLKEQVLKK